jgi:hypothetical protein
MRSEAPLPQGSELNPHKSRSTSIAVALGIRVRSMCGEKGPSHSATAVPPGTNDRSAAGLKIFCYTMTLGKLLAFRRQSRGRVDWICDSENDS